MRTLALLAFLGCAAVAQAQPPKTYTPETAPRPNEETVLNARVVSVDVAGARLTVRGVDVKADGGRDETYSVAAPAASRPGEFKRGMEVLLRLRGATVVDVKVSAASGAQGNTAAGSATRGQTRNGARAGTAANGVGRSATGAEAPVNGTVVPAVGTTLPVGGTGPVIPEGVVPIPATAEPAVAAPSAPNAGPTPSMIGVAPGTGNARTNAQGAITLTGSPAAPSPAARTASPAARAGTRAGTRPAAPRAAATPQPTVTPQPRCPAASGADGYGLASARSGRPHSRPYHSWPHHSGRRYSGRRDGVDSVSRRVRHAVPDAASPAHAEVGRGAAPGRHSRPGPRAFEPFALAGDESGHESRTLAATARRRTEVRGQRVT